MTNKWQRRQTKHDKARYGMRVSGKSIKSLPTGATHTYIVKVKGVGWYTVTAPSRSQAFVKVARRLPRHARKASSDTVTIERKD